MTHTSDYFNTPHSLLTACHNLNGKTFLAVLLRQIVETPDDILDFYFVPHVSKSGKIQKGKYRLQLSVASGDVELFNRGRPVIFSHDWYHREYCKMHLFKA